MFTRKQKIISSILIVVTFAVMVASVIAASFSKQYDLNLNDIAPENIYASRDIEDTVSTNALREEAAAAVLDKYVIDAEITLAKNEALQKRISIIRTVDEDLDAYQQLLDELEQSEENNSIGEDFLIPNRPTPPVINYSETGLSKASFELLQSLPSDEYEKILATAPAVFNSVMSQGVIDKNEGIETINLLLSEKDFSENGLKIAQELTNSLIVSNKFYDEEGTLIAKNEAKASVKTIKVKKNQIIAEKGVAVDEARFAMLTALGLIKGSGSIDIFHTVSVALLLLSVMSLAILYYILLGCKELKVSPIIVSIICCALIVIGSAMVFFIPRISEAAKFLLPLSMIPALVSLLLNANFANIVNIIIAVLAGIQANDLNISVCIILAGSATSYAFSKVVRRTHLLYATFVASAAYAVIYTANFIGTSQSIANILTTFAFSVLGGFFGGILTIGTIPFWEAIFDVITPMKLGELSNPEHKLLKKLLIKAPGSYHHALTVANMADAAAEAIGANALLARVGAYYHDIGKMKNPFYFKENQFGDSNPHDELLPEESAQVLIDHVSDGAALADQYRLPSAVKDIILQHHGTTTTSYFLYKAKEKNPNVDPSIFTYPGPSPISKEATIIMLADACEAAVRAMREKGYVQVPKVVDDIVTSRINDSQLASSELSFADLEKVKASFVQTLEQYFHKRILYPQNEQK